MKIENAKPIIEAILFAAGNPVEISDIAMILEMASSMCLSWE